jgi:two-component system, OmpR family, phosphate regulon sensor histidine kinase PhoR
VSAVEAQYQFAAEFALFLVALAGLSLVALRAELVTATAWARAALATGFAALGTAAFLHGSLIVQEADDVPVVALRAVGILLVGIGASRWTGTAASARLLWAGVGIAAVALGLSVADIAAGAAAARALAAVAIGLALLGASRRSIAARVAASAAATLLLVVLVLSVGLSTVLASEVEDTELRRLAGRARLEAARVDEARREAVAAARLTAAVLVRGEPDELLALAQAPRSSPEVSTALDQIRQSALSELVLGYVTSDGTVAAAAGLPVDRLAPVARSEVVQGALSGRAERGAISSIDGEEHPIALGVFPVQTAGATPGAVRPVGAVVAAAVLSEGYLESRVSDDSSLGLALVTRDGLAVAFGQRGDSVVTRLGANAIASKAGAVEVRGGRLLSARAVPDSDVAVVASTPTTVVDDTREKLFRTLFLIALGGTVLALLLAAVVGDRIGAGLRKLTQAAQAIQRGQPGVRTKLDSDDEVGVLSGAFDSMVSSLEEQRAAEAALRNRVEAIVAGMGEALVAVDQDGVVTDFNRAAEELLGVPASEAEGRELRSVMGLADDAGTMLSPLAPDRWSALAELTPSGVPVAVTSAPLAPGGHVVVLRDLRQEREVERMKREFLSRVGHELRTPLAPIMGYSQILATRQIPAEKAQELHSSIFTSAKRLARIVEMLEFFASIEAGRQVLRPEPVPVRDVLQEVVKRRTDQLNGSHPMSRRVTEGVGMVNADRKWLTLAIDELIDNSVKFSPPGTRITLSARPVDGQVEIRVSDKGPGMEPGDVERVFAEWTQGDESDTRRFGGLGLGLPLVRRVAESLGGRATCESDLGKGTRVSILLPAIPEPNGRSRTRSRSPLG